MKSDFINNSCYMYEWDVRLGGYIGMVLFVWFLIKVM